MLIEMFDVSSWMVKAGETRGLDIEKDLGMKPGPNGPDAEFPYTV